MYSQQYKDAAVITSLVCLKLVQQPAIFHYNSVAIWGQISIQPQVDQLIVDVTEYIG